MSGSKHQLSEQPLTVVTTQTGKESSSSKTCVAISHKKKTKVANSVTSVNSSVDRSGLKPDYYYYIEISIPLF